MGNFRGRWGNLNTMDKLGILGISDKRRKNICTYNKEVGRERVSLSKTSLGWNLLVGVPLMRIEKETVVTHFIMVLTSF
jgi:hypothetical protein